MKRIAYPFFILLILVLRATAQTSEEPVCYRPYVNQAGYNLNESKRFICYGAKDGTPFKIVNSRTSQPVFEGKMLNNEGWFTTFNPVGSADEYVADVEGHGRSVPFYVADHLMEKVSSKLAYDFFIDVRGYENLDEYDMAKVYGGGPSRDSGAYGLETIFEILQYSSNPALFDKWKTEMGDATVPDLIDLILWHAEYAYKYVDYNGPVANRHGSLGYEGEPRMNYDYWNTLDHLAAVCAAYHSFLKPYLSEEKYRAYRKVCLDNWKKYNRHKVVRYWTYSIKWVDAGFQEFNEMGNTFGQSVFSNLLMYLCEKNEKDGQPERFLQWAQEGAKDMIANWDFNNPRHMWWIRNAEHITPQALAFFLMVAPDEAPEGTREKLAAWSVHMKQKTNNFWKYRVHSETEWAHPKTKELGGAPALGGSMFAVAYLLNDPVLRNIGWAQVDFVFGVNPVGAHLSNKSGERVKIGGYWEGVEVGWPQSHPNGYGKLGLVRGTLDGSPLDSQFPIAPEVEKIAGDNEGKAFGLNAYATEGWNVSNRGWLATLTFSTLGSQHLKIFDAACQKELTNAKAGQTITIELKAALNQDWSKADKGWVEIVAGSEPATRIEVTETGVNTGIFTAKYVVPDNKNKLEVSYGYLGFTKKAVLAIQKTYVPYEGFEESDVYQITVNGDNVFAAKEYCFGDSIYHTSQFTVGGETEIVITCADPIERFEIRPVYKNIKGVANGNQLKFKVTQPEMLMVTVNDQKPLCLFQTPPETDIPDPNDPGVVYFGTGVHEVGVLTPQSGQTVYLEQGALVRGRVFADGVTNVTIKGRGIIDARGFTSKPDKICGIEFKNSNHITVEGIGLRTGEWWQSLYLLCRDVNVSYMNLMSFGVNNDGIDIDGVTNFRASHCFIGCGDDGFGWHAVSAEANGEPATQNCIGEDCVILNAHAGNGLRVGASMETTLFKDIIFRNIAVLEHANFGIRGDHSDWAKCENITFENFFIEKPGNAINIKIEKTRYSNDTGYRDERGSIAGLNFINVQTAGGQMVLNGFDVNHAIRNVLFRSCRINGLPLKTADVEVNEFVYDLNFE